MRSDVSVESVSANPLFHGVRLDKHISGNFQVNKLKGRLTSSASVSLGMNPRVAACIVFLVHFSVSVFYEGCVCVCIGWKKKDVCMRVFK